MLQIIILLHTLLVISFTLRILIRDDLSPTSRLAWFMVVTIIPIAGSFIYLLFGEIDIGKSIKAEHNAIIKNIKSHAKKALGENTLPLDTIAPNYQAAFKYCTSINGFKVVGGNRAELMKDAQTARSRLIQDLDNASISINLLYYIWLSDKTGTNVAQAVIRAANRGVTCRVMVDGIGSSTFIDSRLWQDMQAAGVQLSVAFPIKNPLLTMIVSRLDLRNHRKITVIDGVITYCGSQNCADEEFAIKAKFAPWVDIMLRFEGPVVAQNQLLFASDWMLNNKTKIEDFQLESLSIKNGFPAQVMGDGPTERSNSSTQLFTTLIQSAQKSLTISTPYFVPDDTVLNALCACAYRKVRVTIIFPKKNDSWIVSAASRSHYKNMLEAGITIYEYTKGLLHAKTLTLDEKTSFIGSSNMDIRSFALNYENNILLQDRNLTKDILKRQQDYILHSIQVTLKDVQSWSPFKRIWNNIIATISPLL